MVLSNDILEQTKIVRKIIKSSSIAYFYQFTGVRILYVRNLMLSTTEETLKETFEKILDKKDCIERVKKLRDYAFVHFNKREDALQILDLTKDGMEIDGSLVEVVWAKPADKPKSKLANLDENTIIPPAYSSMVNQVGRGRGAAGSRGAGGNKSYLQSLIKGSQRRNPVEGRLYDLLPGVELTPTNPTTLKPLSLKSPEQVLEEICQKNHWGFPVYQLHSAVQRDASTNTHSQFFLFKVTIPAIPSQTIQPNKLCRTVEEAKIYAAEFALIHLGIPVESSEIPMIPGTSGSYHRALQSNIALTQSALPTTPSYIVGKVVPNTEVFYQHY